MADPSSIVPYDNPYDETHYMEEVFNILNNQNPTLEDLTNDEIPILYPQPTDQIDDNTIDPLDDEVIREFCNEPNPQNPQTAPLGETIFGNNVNSIPLSVWPSDTVPFQCSCCQPLRQIVHTNGFVVTKLEIHGRLGLICHAILTFEPGPQYQMFDFCDKSIDEVKQFLIDYCIERSQAGFTMIKDPLSIFYEALCVGFRWEENLYHDNDFIPPSTSNSGVIQTDQAVTSNNQEKPTKPPLAMQRARTRNLTLKEMANYFHLPIEEAAKRLEFSVTVVKNICRKYGIGRWPHRKIQSLEKRKSNWTSRLSSNDLQERARAEHEIERLPNLVRNRGNLGYYICNHL